VSLPPPLLFPLPTESCRLFAECQPFDRRAHLLLARWKLWFIVNDRSNQLGQWAMMWIVKYRSRDQSQTIFTPWMGVTCTFVSGHLFNSRPVDRITSSLRNVNWLVGMTTRWQEARMMLDSPWSFLIDCIAVVLVTQFGEFVIYVWNDHNGTRSDDQDNVSTFIKLSDWLQTNTEKKRRLASGRLAQWHKAVNGWINRALSNDR